ncbi:MAG: DEAD/DEAH box helicase [Clostridiales bacterium]|nr:DEAD/DEAH box helicase [Clostridiales bacterium]
MSNFEITAVFTEDGFEIEKSPTYDKDAFFDQKLYDRFQEWPYDTLYNMGFSRSGAFYSPPVAFLAAIAKRFVDELLRDSDLEITRRAKPADEAVLAELALAIPFALGAEYINSDWLREIWDELDSIFEEELLSFPGSAEDYIKGRNAALNAAGRVFFHLVEYKSEEYPFAFLATYSTGDADNVSHLPLKNALLEHKNEQDKLIALLSAVGKAADKSPFISELVESGELFSPLRFTVKDAYTFLRETEIYESCGVVCRIPDWWRKKGGVRFSVSVGDAAPSKVGLDEILTFSPQAFLGDLEITREEIEEMLSQTAGLSFIKGKWVEVDHNKLKAALDAFNKINHMEGVSFAEAIRMQLGISDNLPVDESIGFEITNGQWLRSVRGQLLRPETSEPVSPGDGFMGKLRVYQQSGLNWLYQLSRLGFGALLADDMGLGKTVQILALLNYTRQNGSSKTLLIIPASLLHNWREEASRFAPYLRFRVIHSQKKDFNIDDADLFITTYGMTARLEVLSDFTWDLVILDEAQAIKNPSVKQTKAVKQLKARNKIAMTGTPVENRLTDLWSIFDFLNKGLLGTDNEFKSFIKKLKDNPGGYSRLRDAVSPFILRRLKTDKSIISDLPDKVEVKAYTTLTKKQVVLYKTLIDEVKAALNSSDGIARKGVVLASIMKFKQICNHPDQYLGQKEYQDKYSGKFEKLAEICDTIREKRERVLVFTQFQEMTAPLSNHLKSIFGREGLILHGGTPVNKRGELVERFNSDEYTPYMVLSIKAGGVGLNLTAANHVIHFDRWWNPAIENQATDRAFRIGQQKNVMVHKFITTGTVEEKIDNMIEAKLKLAEDVIAASGETWITEMDNDELMNLFRLEA